VIGAEPAGFDVLLTSFDALREDLARRPSDQVAVMSVAESVGVWAPSSLELLLLHAKGTSATATPRRSHNMKLGIRRM
jgi:hypothetical protein